jgi:hypothetical protein
LVASFSQVSTDLGIAVVPVVVVVVDAEERRRLPPPVLPSKYEERDGMMAEALRLDAIRLEHRSAEEARRAEAPAIFMIKGEGGTIRRLGLAWLVQEFRQWRKNERRGIFGGFALVPRRGSHRSTRDYCDCYLTGYSTPDCMMACFCNRLYAVRHQPK